uniref:Trna pseudouridine(38/39) synthase n=1 Tax=Triatoma infestans TaxID=30076 RepID=A0A161MGH3_TRIIF
MDFKKVSKDKNKFLDKDDLKTYSNEELISKVLQLQSHNEQLKNIIAKRDYRKNKDTSNSSKFDFKEMSLATCAVKNPLLGWNYQGFVCQEDSYKYHRTSCNGSTF